MKFEEKRHICLTEVSMFSQFFLAEVEKCYVTLDWWLAAREGIYLAIVGSGGMFYHS